MTRKTSSEIENPDSLFDEKYSWSKSDALSRSLGQPGIGRATSATEAAGRRPVHWVSKTLVNFVDASLLVLVVLLFFTAAVLRFVFPASSTAAGWTLWGHGYDAWSNFQFALVAVFGLAIFVDGVSKRRRRGSVAAVQFGGAQASVSGSREDGGWAGGGGRRSCFES